MATRVLGRQFTRQALRDDVYLGQVAQQRREESVTMGYATERKTFYRGRDTPMTDTSEARITTSSADTEHRRRRELEAEQQATHVPMTAEEQAETHRQLAANGW